MSTPMREGPQCKQYPVCYRHVKWQQSNRLGKHIPIDRFYFIFKTRCGPNHVGGALHLPPHGHQGSQALPRIQDAYKEVLSETMNLNQTWHPTCTDNRTKIRQY
jgi:putative component of membrane protein insertase Oxa1/YidC/SpoIIIJ protein YidD